MPFGHIASNRLSARSRFTTFRDAYARRRCIVPIDAFFEWRAIRGERGKQPYAIGLADGSPFGLAGLWENWRDPASGEWIRTFAVITVPANELVSGIHDRMPAILIVEGETREVVYVGAEKAGHDYLSSLHRPHGRGAEQTERAA